MSFDIEALTRNILAVAKAVAPMIPLPGVSAAVTGGVAAAEATLKLIDDSRELFSADQLDELAETQAQLEARVNAHAAATEAALRG
jgi:hypothetical protein